MRRVGNYLLVEAIAQGGMADIYLAKAFGFGGTDQIVAIKSVRPEVLRDPEFVNMFVDEAKLCALLDHENIARTYELNRSGEGYFMAMEYVAGQNLRAISDRASARNLEFPIHLALHIIAQVCEGLDYAHQKTDPTGVPLQIVHQDVSPQNVLVSYKGQVKLIDFGVAQAASHQVDTEAGVVKGKYGYMSPEQAAGATIDRRSDVFATGILLFELLTHRRLFEGASDISILEKVKYAEVYPPSLLAPRVPKPVEDIVLRALTRSPDDRFQSAGAMGEAVVEVLLSSFGQPSSRELDNLMGSLFTEEIQKDMALIESAQGITQMPGDAKELVPGRRPTGMTKALAESRAGKAPAQAPREPNAGATRPQAKRPQKGTASPAANQPFGDQATIPVPVRRPELDLDATADAAISTGPEPERVSTAIVTAHRRKRKPIREILIVTLAVLVSGALVAGTWWYTRAGTGVVTVMSDPTSATVYLDGKKVGQTPFSQSGVSVGEHLLEVQLEQFVPERRTIRVTPGKILDVQVRLKSSSK